MQAAAVYRSAEMNALEPEWQTLALSCAAATIFQTFEWNAAWWQHFGRLPGRRLRVVTFRDAVGKLVGLAPLMTSFWYATPLRRLSFLGTGTSDYLDILAAPGWEQAAAESLYQFLESSGGWQIADWQQLREGSLLRQFLPPAGSRLTVQDVPGEAWPLPAAAGGLGHAAANLRQEDPRQCRLLRPGAPQSLRSRNRARWRTPPRWTPS